ncbi:manganese efflux pump MntP family protein [Salipaludibacillus sp. HK11]|uniref:manganese efflux pump MntP n=1 Tax=Salipaludibacillus sp. HK11 TaxID=3394320 RepID=UPI0039FD4F82
MFNELITIGIMAIALSIDAFSISIGLGLLGIKYRRMALIGLTVGVFHAAMPLFGMLIGRILSQYMGTVAFFIGGSGLVILGVQMVLSSFRYEQSLIFSPRGLGLLIFAVSVSIDSFSAGLSLGMIGLKTGVTVASIAIVSTCFTWAGLVVGKKVGPLVGKRSEWIGGLVLIYFGVKMIVGVS